MDKNTKRILIINGSLRGNTGNAAQIAIKALTEINNFPGVYCEILTLADPMPDIETVRDLLTQHNGFLIVTGSYWNSGGSLLQRFMEVMTVFENTPAFFGKPVACVVSMDSVGGTDVAQNVLSVFSALGCWIPPCATVVISRVGLEAIHATEGQENGPNDDVWRMEDIEVLVKNLIISSKITADWEHWPFRPLTIEKGPWPQSGFLDLDSPNFL